MNDYPIVDDYVEIGPDSVTIYDEDGYEVVHWIQDEWVEDPEVVISIANALHLYHTHGVDALKAVVGWRRVGNPDRAVR